MPMKKNILTTLLIAACALSPARAAFAQAATSDFSVAVSKIVGTGALVTVGINGAAAKTASLNTALQNGDTIASVNGVISTVKNVENLLQGMLGSGAFGNGVASLVNTGIVSAALGTLHNLENSLQGSIVSGNFNSVGGTVSVIKGVSMSLQTLAGIFGGNNANTAAFNNALALLSNMGTTVQGVANTAGSHQAPGGPMKFHVAYGRTKGFLNKKTGDCVVDPSVAADLSGTKTCSFPLTGLAVGKKYYYKLKGNIAIPPEVPNGSFLSDQQLPHVDSLKVVQTATDITPAFHFEGIPPKDIELYAWIGKGDGTWMKRDKLLVTVNRSSSSVSKDFNVVFKYSELGLENGKQYAYLIADGTSDSAKLYTPMAFFTVGSLIAGGPACTEPSDCVDPVSLELRPIEVTDTSVTIKGTLYANEAPVTGARFSIAIGPDASSIGVMVPSYEGAIPLAGVSFSKTFQGFAPGTPYIMHLLEETTGTDFGNQTFTTTGKAPVAPDKSLQGGQFIPDPQVEVAGVTVSFPAAKQVVEKNRAEIRGIVSVNLPLAVDLSYVSSAAGSPLQNEQNLIAKQMVPGSNQEVTLTFNGLASGKSYQFAIRNKVTNSMSKPFGFTTPGGTTNETALFEGMPVGDPGSAGSFTEMPDTISDKGIVPRCGLTKGPGVTAEEEKMCGYADFLQLISNIVTYGLILIGPVIAVMAMYSGAMIIILGKNSDPTGDISRQLASHKARLVKIAIGIAIMLMSYVIISTIIRELGVKKEYQLLDVVTGN